MLNRSVDCDRSIHPSSSNMKSTSGIVLDINIFEWSSTWNQLVNCGRLIYWQLNDCRFCHLMVLTKHQNVCFERDVRNKRHISHETLLIRESNAWNEEINGIASKWRKIQREKKAFAWRGPFLVGIPFSVAENRQGKRKGKGALFLRVVRVRW